MGRGLKRKHRRGAGREGASTALRPREARDGPAWCGHWTHSLLPDELSPPFPNPRAEGLTPRTAGPDCADIRAWKEVTVLE